MTESSHNVVVVELPDADTARQALSVLEERHAEGQIAVRADAAVVRREDGGLDVLDLVDHRALSGSATGSLIGALIGIIGGPFGILLGWGSGQVLGIPRDVHGAHQADDTLAALGQAIPVGSAAVVAEVEEPDVRVVDGEMARLGGAVTRRPADEVLADLDTAKAAAAAAEKAARRELLARRRAEVSEGLGERVRKLKERLGVA